MFDEPKRMTMMDDRLLKLGDAQIDIPVASLPETQMSEPGQVPVRPASNRKPVLAEVAHP